MSTNESFQKRVQQWVVACMGEAVATDRTERNFRFLEEALELTQACGCSREDTIRLVDYVHSRPEGEPSQEVGGVMVTLASLCAANGLDLDGAAEAELVRVWAKIDVIRVKHFAKPIQSPLPGPSATDRKADENARDPAASIAVQAWILKRIQLGKNTENDAQILEAIEWCRAVEAEQVATRVDPEPIDPKRLEMAAAELSNAIRLHSNPYAYSVGVRTASLCVMCLNERLAERVPGVWEGIPVETRVTGPMRLCSEENPNV